MDLTDPKPELTRLDGKEYGGDVAYSFVNAASKKLFSSCKSEQFEIGGILTDSGSQSVKAFKEVYGHKPCSLDTWHALKGDEAKLFKKIGSGTRKTEGVLWHRTLYDKETKKYLSSTCSDGYLRIISYTNLRYFKGLCIFLNQKEEIPTCNFVIFDLFKDAKVIV